MTGKNRKTFSNALLFTARDEVFKQYGIYSYLSPGINQEEKERLQAFNDFIKERFQKMFMPLVRGKELNIVPDDFFDKFVFCYEDNEKPNACCFPRELPDGKIFVVITKGMIDLSETEGELMGIIGHEVGHYLHTLMKGYKRNDVPEEALSDTIAIEHMPNAGYHPSEFDSIFEKMDAFYEKKKKENPNSKMEKIWGIFDPHPENRTRRGINRLIIQKDDHRYQHLNKTLLDKQALDMTGLQRFDSVFDIQRDGVLLPLKEGQTALTTDTAVEGLNKILDQAESLSIPLVSNSKTLDILRSDKTPRILAHEFIWSKIFSDYLKGEENELEIDILTDENRHDPSKHHHYILNKIYWEKMSVLNEIISGDDLIKPVWERIRRLNRVGEHTVVDMSSSLINSFLNKHHTYFRKYFSFTKGQYLGSGEYAEVVEPANLETYFEKEELFERGKLPTEIVEIRRFIKELLTRPDKISSDFVRYMTEVRLGSQSKDDPAFKKFEQDKDVQQFKQMLSLMTFLLDKERLSYINVSYLLAPVIACRKEGEHPLYDIMHLKVPSVDPYEKECIHRFQQNLLTTLGYYDSSAFELNKKFHHLLGHYKSDSGLEDYSYIHYTGLQNDDIKSMDEHSVFVLNSGIDSLRCEYNNRTKTITHITPVMREMDAKHQKFETVGKIAKGAFHKAFSHPSYAIADNLVFDGVNEHNTKLYKIKTHKLNAQMHYHLKDVYHSFDKEKLSPQNAVDIINYAQHYLFEDILNLFEDAPFVLKGMNWKYKKLSMTPLGEFARQRNEKNSWLFDYGDEDFDFVAKGYLNALQAGRTDPKIAKVLIENTILNRKENPALFILMRNKKWPNGVEMGLPNTKVVNELYVPVLRILNQSPYLDEIDDSFWFPIYDDKLHDRNDQQIAHDERFVQDMYEVAPCLCAKIFGLYELDEQGNKVYMTLPIKTPADLEKMHQLYQKNDARCKNKVYQNPLSSDLTLFDKLLAYIHDKYITKNNDMPMQYSVKFGKFLGKGYFSAENKIETEEEAKIWQGYLFNAYNRENWPDTMRECITLMAQNYTYAYEDKYGDCLSDIAPKEIIQEYHQMIYKAPTLEAKLSLLSYAVTPTSKDDKMTVLFEDYGQNKRRMAFRLSRDTKKEIFSPTRENSIWNNGVKENVHMYVWLKDRQAFNGIKGMDKEIVAHIINQIEKQAAPLREKYAFLMLTKRADVPFPENKKQLINIWVQSVREMVGSIDDMSDAYIQKVTPFISKLKNEKISRSGGTASAKKYPDKKMKHHKLISKMKRTELSLEIQKELVDLLQDALVAQPKLAFILDPNATMGSLSSSGKNEMAGELLNLISHNTEEGEASALIDFFLAPITPQSVATLQKGVTQRVTRFFNNYHIDVDEGDNLHKEFWSKDIVVRLAVLTLLFERGYKDHDARINNMLDRIFKEQDDKTAFFRQALYNYATAVDKQEMYKADTLLSGCLASSLQEAKNSHNLGETIRKFLESQGAAGVKVGQFLSAHEDIPEDIRMELKKLTNQASTPSRAEVFSLIREKHPELFNLIIQSGGLGKCLGAASHYLTYEMGDKVVSVSRPESASKAVSVYNRLEKALEKTLEQQPQNAHLLHVIRDAIRQARSMNDMELDANIGYKQSILATTLYDNVAIAVDGHRFTFKTMPWDKPDEKTGPYHVVVQDGVYSYSQSFKIMEKAGGVDYDTIESGDYKTAIAKANFLLNLRMIMKGDVFDDDRHTGQLKVEQLSENETRINLFDTGSTSIEKPTKEDLNSFGQALHRTLRAVMILNSNATQDEKIASLGRLFKKTEKFDEFFTPKGAVVDESLFKCFNLAVNELRDEEGSASLYISKVERSLANLSHFSNDIPVQEMLPLVFNLVKEKGNIHPEIINAMGMDGFDFDNRVMQTIIPEGRLNPDMMGKIEKPIAIEEALATLMRPTNITDAEQMKAYNNALVEMCFVPDKIAFDEHLNSTLAQINDEQVKQKLSQNIGGALNSFVQALQSGKDETDIARDVLSYLKKTGFQEPFISGVRSRLPAHKRALVNIAFYGGSETLKTGDAFVLNALKKRIKKVVGAWNSLSKEKEKLMQSDTTLVVLQKLSILSQLVEAEQLTSGQKIESKSNKAIGTIDGAYQNKKKVRQIKADRLAKLSQELDEARSLSDADKLKEKVLKEKRKREQRDFLKHNASR